MVKQFQNVTGRCALVGGHGSNPTGERLGCQACGAAGKERASWRMSQRAVSEPAGEPVGAWVVGWLVGKGGEHASEWASGRSDRRVVRQGEPTAVRAGGRPQAGWPTEKAQHNF